MLILDFFYIKSQIVEAYDTEQLIHFWEHLMTFGHRDGSHCKNQSSTIVITYLPSSQYTSQSAVMLFFLRIRVPENKKLLNDVFA